SYLQQGTRIIGAVFGRMSCARPSRGFSLRWGFWNTPHGARHRRRSAGRGAPDVQPRCRASAFSKAGMQQEARPFVRVDVARVVNEAEAFAQRAVGPGGLGGSGGGGTTLRCCMILS